MLLEERNNKQAATSEGVVDLIRDRWSARSFDENSLSEDELNTILEAATWAPSAMNEQPWRFVVARRSEAHAFDELVDFLLPGNAIWARKAGALVLVLGKANYDHKNRPNGNVLHDCGMATMNLLLQATSMGIHGHVMEGFDKSAVSTLYNLGEELIPVTMVALGFLDEPEKLEEPYLSRETAPRRRKPLSDVVFSPESMK